MWPAVTSVSLASGDGTAVNAGAPHHPPTCGTVAVVVVSRDKGRTVRSVWECTVQCPELGSLCMHWFSFGSPSARSGRLCLVAS
jgi:hypothetical protein